MQKHFFLPAIFISLNVFAQHSIDSLVQTERKFANTALTAGTRDAFINFIDTAGIVFEKGKPVNGLRLYNNSGKSPGLLNWEPELAEISSSNDFGYTTGPWKYYPNSLKEDPVAQGHFITVWHLTADGKWKFLIDFGISYPARRNATPLETVHAEVNKFKGDGNKSLKDAEEKFIEAYSSNGTGAYRSFLSTRSRLNYKGFFPATTSEERKALLDSLPKNINYTILGLGISPNNQLGYVYGSAALNNIQDGYLRIWRREKDGWKIAVEVLHFR
jgi:ketosteroid isomerase-like protein